MVVGDPDDPATEIGPLVAERQQERVDKYIALGQEEGARVVVGGNGRPDGIDKGWYVQPTVFADVDNRMRIAQEEIFGPVLAVIPYDDVDDAVRIANDSEFGLAGSVWTGDEDQGMDIARRVRTGTYGVNQYTMDFVAPFGGFKASGIGREFGREGLEHYLELKSHREVVGEPAPARRARRARRHRHPQPTRGPQRAVRRDARPDGRRVGRARRGPGGPRHRRHRRRRPLLRRCRPQGDGRRPPGRRVDASLQRRPRPPLEGAAAPLPAAASR